MQLEQPPSAMAEAKSANMIMSLMIRFTTDPACYYRTRILHLCAFLIKLK
jgi:hypothetical protein